MVRLVVVIDNGRKTRNLRWFDCCKLFVSWTETSTSPGCAKADALSWVATVALSTTVVAAGVPFHRMTESASNPDPLTCKLTALETRAAVGVTAAIIGATLLLLLLLLLLLVLVSLEP